jgi:hypothetical protein
MTGILKFATLLLCIALLVISAPAQPTVAEVPDEGAALSGSVWIIPSLPEQLTIFEVRPDGSVEAGRWGFAGMAKDIIWTGTFRNGRLELKNQKLAEAPLIYPEYGPPTETINATIAGSQITGHYNYTAKALNAYDDRDFSGYCLNCFGYGPPLAVITIGGLLVGGGIVLLRRRKKKRLRQPGGEGEDSDGEEKTDDEEDSDDDEDQSCGGRKRRVLAAVADYEKQDRRIGEVLEIADALGRKGETLIAELQIELDAAMDDYNSRLKYLLLLESGEKVVEWGSDALMWGGGLAAGAISRLASARAAKFALLAKDAARLGIPASTGVGVQTMEARGALASAVGDVATTFGIMAAFVGSLAYFAPAGRKNLEQVYKEISLAQQKLDMFKMCRNIQREKLSESTEALTRGDQSDRLNEILRLHHQMVVDCMDEYQQIRGQIGGDDASDLPRVRGLKQGWQSSIKTGWSVSLE